MAERAGLHIGQLHGEPAASFEVDHGEDDRWTGGVGHPVDREGHDPASGVGHGDRFHVIEGPASHGHPGRRKVHRTRRTVLGAHEGELPFLAPPGGAGGHTLGLGPPGWLEAHHVAPTQELPVAEGCSRFDLLPHRAGRREGAQGVRRAEDEDVGSVGQMDERDDPTRADVCERSGLLLDHRCQHQPGLSRARLSDGGPQVVAQGVVTDAELAHQRLVGSRVHAGDDDPIDLGADQSHILEGALPRLLAERHVTGLAEAFLPQLRSTLARSAPSIEELVGGRSRAEPLGDDAGARRVIADHDRRRRIAADGLVSARGQTIALISRDHHDGVTVGERRVQGAGAGAQRPSEVKGRNGPAKAQRGMEHGGVGLVEVGRIGGGEPQRGRVEAWIRAQGEAGRLDAESRCVLVMRGDRTGALAPASSEERLDLRPVQTSIGDVAGGTQNSTHRRDGTRGRMTVTRGHMQYAVDPEVCRLIDAGRVLVAGF